MDNSIFKQVGNNIQNILESNNITQQHLADRLGISKQVMSKIISGSKAINAAEISKIAAILNVSSDILLSVDSTSETAHCFSFMGKVKNPNTKAKIEMLQAVIDEIVMLEDYADDK